MGKHQHLKLPLFQGNIEQQKRAGGGGFSLRGRNKARFSKQASQQAKTFLWLQRYDEGLLDEPDGQVGGHFSRSHAPASSVYRSDPGASEPEKTYPLKYWLSF